MQGNLGVANTRDFWLPIRLFQWLAEEAEQFSLDAFKTYIALCSIGASRAISAGDEVVLSPLRLERAATRVFAEESEGKHPSARLRHALDRLIDKGLLTERADGFLLCGTAGEAYCRSVSRNPKRGNFIMAKALFHEPRKDGAPAPILDLDSEEILLLMLLYQGTRWAWGGVHGQYAKHDEASGGILGTAVTELFQGARVSDKKNNFGTSTSRTDSEVLQSLIEKGYFSWQRVLLAHASNRLGDKLSTQRTVVFRSDMRFGRANEAEGLSTVLVPRYGYTLGNYQSQIVKAIYSGELEYYDTADKRLSFRDCAALKLWGVDRWRIGTPRQSEKV